MRQGWTRLQLANLLKVVIEKNNEEVLRVIQSIGTVSTDLQQKLINCLENNKLGFSMNDIATLGNQLECTTISETALKNWVKREMKEFIGSPEVGKKYSIQQAALLYIVKDLKTILDFEAIRPVLRLVFNNPKDRKDDLISPVKYLLAYSNLYEELVRKGEILTEDYIANEVKEYMKMYEHLSEKQQSNMESALMVSILSVRAAYIKAIAMNYVQEAPK
ncbi:MULTISPECIES: DUF1836 domain-containing protein [Bacillus]|uniref:DUF1836 domain-containing protein n=1 Tax=Bacillus TaxID=1386 RepID=UPI000BB778EA|nr:MULTISPECIES: DUF1836 domain-containing protein [Bacillus]